VNAIVPYINTGDSCVRTSGTWYVNHFDAYKAASSLFGAGAYPEVKEDVTEVASIPVTPSRDNELYEFSCWFLLEKTSYRSPYCTLELLDSAGNKLGGVDMLTKESTDNHGLWFRGYLFFPVPGNCSRIKCLLNNDKKDSYKIMDEMMLRPADAVIISKAADGKVMVNNHLFGNYP